MLQTYDLDKFTDTGVFCLWCFTDDTNVVDRPTQLIWIFICQHTSTKDIAGQSANTNGTKTYVTNVTTR